MRENEFENRVKQKMDGFNLHPSDEVWTEVERRIRKEKKRRFIFWWPLLFLVGGGIAAGILLTTKKEKTETITVDKNAEKPRLPDGPTGQAGGQAKITEPTANVENDNPEIPGNKTTTTITQENITETKRPSVKATTTPMRSDERTLKETTVIRKPEANRQVSTKNMVSVDKKDKNKEDQAPATVVVPSKPINTLPDPGKTIDIAVSPKQNIQQKDQQQELVQKTTDSINVEKKPNPVNKKLKKWDWGISLSLGRSSIENGLHFFNGAMYADALQLGSPASSANRPASSIQPSLSWSAGLYIKQPVSKNLEINLGVGYMYLSTKMNVGARVDSARNINNSYSSGLSVDRFYRPSFTANNSSYTNQYHFMSLSGDLSWRIINGKKLSIYWENGLQYNRLIASSMLHYDRSIPGYYKDNKRLTKNHVFISTGFSVPIGKKVIVNPFATYSLTRVLKNSDSSGTNYTNYGIRIRFLLNKK